MKQTMSIFCAAGSLIECLWSLAAMLAALLPLDAPAPILREGKVGWPLELVEQKIRRAGALKRERA